MRNGENKERVLVVAPHPDDDIIGCGGSMAKHLKYGNEVFVIYVTNGDADCQKYSREEFRKIRRQEIKNAAKVMGLKEENLFFLDNRSWEINETGIRFALLRLIRKIKPDVCYVPHAEENHFDHKIANRAAIDALNMGPSRWFKKYGSEEESSGPAIILAYEVWTSLTSPSYLEDVSDFLETKMASLREHKTQDAERYENAYRGMNAFRGAMHRGVKYAEAFQVIRIPRIFPWNKNSLSGFSL